MSSAIFVFYDSYWGVNSAVEEFVCALSDEADKRFGPANRLSILLREQREQFFQGRASIHLDSILTDPSLRSPLIEVIEAAGALVAPTFSEHCRAWMQSTTEQLRQRIESGPWEA